MYALKISYSIFLRSISLSNLFQNCVLQIFDKFPNNAQITDEIQVSVANKA